MSGVPGVTSNLALILHGLGFSIFPVPMPRPGALTGRPGDGKTPDVPWKFWQTARADEAQIIRWFVPPQNVAIVTGEISGVVVVDCDTDEALAYATRHLPYTPWQVYTAKGFHLYYRHPGTPVRNRARISTSDGRLALDVRGDGGYVIGPWSEHASGAMYHAVGDWDAPTNAARADSMAAGVSGVDGDRAAGVLLQVRKGEPTPCW